MELLLLLEPVLKGEGRGTFKPMCMFIMMFSVSMYCLELLAIPRCCSFKASMKTTKIIFRMRSLGVNSDSVISVSKKVVLNLIPFC